jgi:hypothetical protein
LSNGVISVAIPTTPTTPTTPAITNAFGSDGINTTPALGSNASFGNSDITSIACYGTNMQRLQVVHYTSKPL